LKLRVSRSFHGPTCLVLEQCSVQDTESFLKRETVRSHASVRSTGLACGWGASARGSSLSLSAELKSGTDATRCPGCSLGVCVDRRNESGCFILQTWLHISHSVYVEVDKLTLIVSKRERRKCCPRWRGLPELEHSGSRTAHPAACGLRSRCSEPALQ